MRFSAVFLLLSVPFLFPVPARAAGTSIPEACAAPVEFIMPGKSFPLLARAIRHEVPLEFLAVGSATTVGQDGGGGRAFPHWMIEGLRAALPGHEIHLTIRGARGLTATQMLTLIEQELKDKRFALVLWQTGAVEAAHGASVEELRATIDAGIVAVRGAGSELVLIDPQYSRFLSAKVNLMPYIDALKDAADVPDVALFRRNDLMKFWVDDGRVDLERVKKADQEAAVDALHSCLGAVLAHFVANGAGVAMP